MRAERRSVYERYGGNTTTSILEDYALYGFEYVPMRAVRAVSTLVYQVVLYYSLTVLGVCLLCRYLNLTSLFYAVPLQYALLIVVLLLPVAHIWAKPSRDMRFNNQRSIVHNGTYFITRPYARYVSK